MTVDRSVLRLRAVSLLLKNPCWTNAKPERDIRAASDESLLLKNPCWTNGKARTRYPSGKRAKERLLAVYSVLWRQWNCHTIFELSQRRQRGFVGSECLRCRQEVGEVVKLKEMCSVILWTKSCGVTIQMKPLQQYFYMVLFIL